MRNEFKVIVVTFLALAAFCFHGMLNAEIIYDDGDGIINSTWIPPVTNEDGTSFADPVNPTPDEMDGYRFKCGPVGGPYDSITVLPVGVTFPVDIQTWSTVDVNECFVTAFDRSGNESGPSNVIQWAIDTTGPAAPSSLAISVSVTVTIK